MQQIVALLVSSAGLGVFLLTFGLPAVRAIARWRPLEARVVAIWITELGKGGLAGASVGAGLGTLLPTSGPLTADQMPGRVLVIGLVTAIGLLVGGLRADGRVRGLRRPASAGPEAS